MRWCDIIFGQRRTAEAILDDLLDLAKLTPDHFVFITDYLCLVQWYSNDHFSDADVDIVDEDLGWNLIQIQECRVVRISDGGYTIQFDTPIKKEENLMGSKNYASNSLQCAYTPVNPCTAKDDETLAYEEAKRKIQEDADKKVQKIMDETSRKLKQLEEEQYWARKKKAEEEQALCWKTKYDALVEAGFTEDQAWQMTMESFKLD